MKVVFHYDAGPALRRQLDAYRGVGLDIAVCPETDDERFGTQIGTADALWHVLKPVTAAVIAKAPRLKLIQKIGVGVNTIDLEAARAAHIAVCNMPGTNSRAVAEMTLLLMLSSVRLQPRVERICRTGGWALDAQTRESFSEIAGKTVGLVGFGATAQLLAPMLEAMGANVIFSARQKRNSGYPQYSLPELARRADIVSLHVPLTPETTRLFDEAMIRSMKPGAIFINTARGGLVDEAALQRALEDGHIRAAGLDVFEVEPVGPDNPLLKMDTVTVAPHVAWLTKESLARSVEIAAANTLAMANSGVLRHRVV